jgi:hypothetical protein
MLEEFRELVRAGILRVTPENEVLSVKEPPAAGAEKQPQTAASREEDVALLDKQLLEWLERRRQQKAEEAKRRETGKPLGEAPELLPGNIRQRVIERVAEKILETWDRADQTLDPLRSLREQVIDRLAEDILRRWQRNLE